MNLIEVLSNSSLSSLIPTSDGAFTLKDEEDRFIHSSRAPLKESKKLLKNIESYPPNDTLVIVWGTGLGYHVESLIQQGFDVVAIEFRATAIEAFKHHFPLNLLEAFITDASKIFDVIVQLEKPYQYFVDISMLGFGIPQGAWTLKQQAITALRSLHQIKLNLLDTWYLNILQNLSLLQHKHIGYTDSLFLTENELVICSAGPSLKESLPALKKNRSNFVVLSVDTALSVLLGAEIIPDFVHAVDAKIHNIADFRGIDESIFSQIVLIADISLSPQVVSLPWKEVLFVSTAQPLEQENGIILSRHHLQQFLWDKGIRFPETQTGGSVATSAFHLGVLYQAKKILLLGQDLAYSNHRGHSVGSPYDKEYRLQTNRLRSLDTIHVHKIPFENSVKGIDDVEVYTDPLLMQFRSWFEVSLQHNVNLQKISINASENGALFKFWTHQSLSTYSPSTQSNEYKYTLKSYSSEKIQQIYAELAKLKDTHPILQDYFYKHMYFPMSEMKIQKKKGQWNKKISLN